uniref:non-specific serine/threonine protein kinase n=1 Tax=Manihot esculenta TaxID=3983 RepID=A0A2C9UY66_MANES
MRPAMKREYTTIFDPTLQGNYNRIEMDRMLYCAAACVYKPSAFRPQIKKIVGVLEGSIPWKDIWDESDDQILSDAIVKGPFLMINKFSQFYNDIFFIFSKLPSILFYK